MLVLEFGCTAGPGHVVEIPDGNQLAGAEGVAAAVDVPVIELTGAGLLHGIAEVAKPAAEERKPQLQR